MDANSYRTIAGGAEAEFVERRSRFIGQIAPAESEADALRFVEEISRRRRDAAHNVYAFRLRTGAERCADNGEPRGTAGVPMLDVLQRESLTDVCLVVTRYFGGILLGTGGLVRAYAHAAKIAVGAAEIVTMCVCVKAEVSCDYSFYGKLAYILPEHGAVPEDTQFGTEVRLLLRMRGERYEGFAKAVTELSNGRFEAVKAEAFFGAM